MANVKIEDSWKKQLANEFDKDYMKSLSDYLKNEKKLGKDINSDDEEDEYDPNNVKKRGGGPKISVKKSRW